MAFVKAIKNKAYFKRFQVKYRRRRGTHHTSTLSEKRGTIISLTEKSFLAFFWFFGSWFSLFLVPCACSLARPSCVVGLPTFSCGELRDDVLRL